MISLSDILYRAARLNPQSIATSHHGREHSWALFLSRVERFANGLSSLPASVVPESGGRHIAILSLNNDRYLESLYAISLAGDIMVPLNTRWAEAENHYALDDSASSMLIFDDAFSAVALSLKKQLPGLKHLVYIGEKETPEGAISAEDLIQNSPKIKASGRKGQDMAGLFYTGGTTGFPKGVMQSHGALWASGISLNPETRMSSSSTYLHVAPMFHMADFAGGLSAVSAGARHLFLPGFDPTEVLETIDAYGITHALLVPTMIKALLAHPDIAKAKKLEMITYGASPMPAAVLAKAIELLPMTGFLQAYGQTELAPIASVLTVDDHLKGGDCLASAGRASMISDIRIVDEDDNDCPLGTPGEIIVKGPHTMLGYWKKPEETAKALRDGWVYTGDAAYFDEDRYIYIVDRVKDMVITGGENVFTTEVENALISHPDVLDVSVIGIPHEDWVEAVHAIVIPSGDKEPSLDDLVAHAKQKIAGYKCPKSLTIRREPFPLSGAGKVLKTELRKPYWQGRERSV